MTALLVDAGFFLSGFLLGCAVTIGVLKQIRQNGRNHE